ncbi:MAG: ion transporter [Opitutales bacterium]|nr:ion transporter [Opitutales bacterium]
MADIGKRSEISAGLRGGTLALSNWILRFLRSGVAHFLILFCILLSMASVILSSFSETSRYVAQLYAVTCATSAIFFAEYLLRLYSAPAARPGAPALRARLGYAFSFYGFVDFVAVIPFLLAYMYGDTEISRIIILPYIFTMFKLIRYSPSLRLIGEVLGSVKGELAAAYAACSIIVCFSATLMYFLERSAQPEVFENIGDGLWWSIVTFTTVGYGDIYPVTPLGKILGGLISLVGIAMIALPTAIISSAFISVMQSRMKRGNPPGR